ncbi:MAG: hypothetical protein GVY25_11975 [Bacteroidetes bacterium]|jgi:hypothetical protein|nr:hypothetical protein [Bacteroidota bacterium]
MMRTIHPLNALQRVGGIATLALALLLFVGPQDANAQRWLQTTQVIAPVQSETPTRALLDTLINVIDRSDSLAIKRAPDDPSRTVVSQLEDELLNQEGIGLSSANYVFIDYRFEVNRDGFEERITDLFFIYRPPGTGEEDIPIMYLSARDSWVGDVLQNKGTTLVTNEAALKPFGDQIAFAKIVRERDARIVEIGDRTVRDGFEAKKRNLVDKITRLSYSSR